MKIASDNCEKSTTRLPAVTVILQKLVSEVDKLTSTATYDYGFYFDSRWCLGFT